MSKQPNPEMIDDDNPEWTDADFARAKRLHQMPASLRKNLGGRPRLDNPKVAVSIRLDPVVLAAWKATGRGWQTRMAAALAEKAPTALGHR